VAFELMPDVHGLPDRAERLPKSLLPESVTFTLSLSQRERVEQGRTKMTLSERRVVSAEMRPNPALGL